MEEVSNADPELVEDKDLEPEVDTETVVLPEYSNTQFDLDDDYDFDEDDYNSKFVVK